MPGDCNETLTQVLGELSDLRWAPTFAFLDQQSTEVRWTTLQQLAMHKRRGKPKAELWLLCASGLIPRGLKIRQELDTKVIERTNTMLDTDIWLQALEATRDERLTGQQFRDELTNLMRWRLEKDLGYKKTRVFQVTNTGGQGIFDMIFATDHEVGDKIMKWVSKKAADQQPKLRQQAKLRRRQTKEEDKGIVSLFDVAEFAEAPQGAGFHVDHEDAPPHPPYQHP